MSEDKYAAVRAIPLRNVLAMCGSPAGNSAGEKRNEQ